MPRWCSARASTRPGGPIATVSKLTFGEKISGAISDLPAHAILDRGRLVGYWEFDSEASEIVPVHDSVDEGVTALTSAVS